MAEKPPQPGVDLDRRQFCCPVCLDLFREPVTVPCGHSYCRGCIEECWQQVEAKARRYSCPQCREVFQSRPVLGRNHILAEVVAKLEGTSTKKTSPSAGLTCAGPEDVACDFCCKTSRNKASMSCLTCMASYCDSHLAPHYRVPVLKMHQLVSVTVPLDKKMCKKHNKLMEIYCQTDKICICYLCTIDKHRGHRTISAKAERATEQMHLFVHQTNVQKSLQEREHELKELVQALEDFKICSQNAVEDIDHIEYMLISSIQKKHALAKQMICVREKQAVSEAQELQLQLEKVITKLRKRKEDLHKLSLTSDHIHFIQAFPALSTSCESPALPPSAVVRPRESMEAVSQFVCNVKDKMEDLLNDIWPSLSTKVSAVNVVLPPVPKSRGQFLLYSRSLTLDVKTVDSYLSISEDQRRLTHSGYNYYGYSDRFQSVKRVLCREALSERCYWEVMWKGSFCAVAVAYENSKPLNDLAFGNDDKSWSLECSKNGYIFRHQYNEQKLSGPQSFRIGVYLDYKAGSLAFYSISKTMTLLHKEKTTFSQPLYPGLGLKKDDSTNSYVEIMKLW
ncbi:tripartite motif-containing protein 16 isoform X1 [Fundulus heteroclitus]|uniref:tripartite motif-containing protein 16 isoform X1 n=1 Tax=Fundulus heteroclitus TaxID=8078 RepID=UPI00165AC91B|nr:tripartite motif-containing protein 16 isoform X1 [Fundulus heteroclitus]